ncbi:hypothetical protein DVB69_11010 [Sporosarcina sp. BI001-red]|nr:hypothetical protein DVB69_11010 [Sporosarcina sp. BI001-red]
MNNRFELSFKNKEVRVWLAIMIPTALGEIAVILLSETPNSYINALLPLLSWTVFFIWRYFYKRKQKKLESLI